jgi:hypothetical protein
LAAIIGRLKGAAMTAGPGDTEDMFLIEIIDPENFVAETAPPTGSASFDTQLWLFDSQGRGVLGNDDAAPGVQGSRIRSPSDDGSAIPHPGRYYLAISGKNDFPINANGAIFNQASATEVSGPDGPGGGFPIEAWSGPGPTGDYMIRLTGAGFVDASVPAVSQWGVLALALLLLCSASVILARRRALAGSRV